MSRDLGQAPRSLGEHLVGVLRGVGHDLEDVADEVRRHLVVEEVAHRVDEDHPGRPPAPRDVEHFGVDCHAEPGPDWCAGRRRPGTWRVPWPSAAWRGSARSSGRSQARSDRSRWSGSRSPPSTRSSCDRPSGSSLGRHGDQSCRSLIGQLGLLRKCHTPCVGSLATPLPKKPAPGLRSLSRVWFSSGSKPMVRRLVLRRGSVITSPTSYLGWTWRDSEDAIAIMNNQ